MMDSFRTPEECYVYRRWDSQVLALQGVLYVVKPYTAPTERERKPLDAINILLLRSKVCILGVVLEFTFVQSNLHVNLFFTSTHVNLTFLLFLIQQFLHPERPSIDEILPMSLSKVERCRNAWVKLLAH